MNSQLKRQILVLLVLVFGVIITLPQKAQANAVEERIARELVQKFMAQAERNSSKALPWLERVDAAFTEVLTLEAQQVLRNSYKGTHGKILAGLRKTWFQRTWNKAFRGNTYKRAVRGQEQRAANSLERTYQKLAEKFESQESLIRFIEENNLVARKIISTAELDLLKGLKVIGELEAAMLGVAGERAAIKSLQQIRDVHITKELEILLTKTDRKLTNSLKDFELIFRGLSEQNQYLWSYAEARFALKFHYSMLRLIRNHWSRSISLRGNWITFWDKYSIYFKRPTILVPKHIPLTPGKLENMFMDLTNVLSQSLATVPPGVLLRRPSKYIERLIEYKAKTLSAEFEVARSLINVSPDFHPAINANKSVRREAKMLQLEKVFDEQGFVGLFNAVYKEGVSLEESIAQALAKKQGPGLRHFQIPVINFRPISPIPGTPYVHFRPFTGVGVVHPMDILNPFRLLKSRYSPMPFTNSGTYFRSWLGSHIFASMFALISYIQLAQAGPQEDELQRDTSLFPGEMPIGGVPQLGGEAPELRPFEDLSNGTQMALIRAYEIEIQGWSTKIEMLQDQTLLMEPEYSEETGEEMGERAEINREILEIEKTIKFLQEQIIDAYRTMGIEPPKIHPLDNKPSDE